MKTLSFHPAILADRMAVQTLDFSRPFVAQVREFFEQMPDISGEEVTGLPGQAVAAALTLPVLEMAKGLPTMALFGFGKEAKVLGTLALDDFRHNAVRSRRGEQPEGGAFTGWTLLDAGGRGIEPHQLTELAAALGTTPEQIRVVDISMGHIDPADPSKGLVDRLLATGLTKADWVSGRLVFLPPGFGPLAAVMATAIYGMSEVWPRTVRLNRESDGVFHVAEVVDPQPLRQFGVALGAKWRAGNAPVSVPRDLMDRMVSVLTDSLGDTRTMILEDLDVERRQEVLRDGEAILDELRALVEKKS